MTSNRISPEYSRRSIRFQVVLTAICLAVPLTIGWFLRGSPHALAIFGGFAWLGGVLVAAVWGGYISGAAVVVLFYLLLPLLIAHRIATNYDLVMRTILLLGVSLLVSWIAYLRRRS